MKNWLLLFGSLVLTLSTFAQANYGSLKGEVKEYDSWENVPFANVSLYQEGEMILGAHTDFDGEYQINEDKFGVLQTQFKNFHSRIA